jgi:hypothetical protein
MPRRRRRPHDWAWHEAQMAELYGPRGANTRVVNRARQRMKQVEQAELVRQLGKCPHGYVGGTCSVCEWMKGNGR